MADRWAVKNHLMERNVTRDLDRDDRPGSKRQTEPRYLDAGQVELLLAQMSDELRPVAAVCAYAGLRISEALGPAGHQDAGEHCHHHRHAGAQPGAA